MCFSTARLVRTSVSAIAALLLPLAISARTSRSRPVSAASGRALDAQLGGDERLDDLRVQHRAAGRDRLDRRHQLGAIVDALLEQIGAALRSGLQQRQRVGGLGVVAQHDHADPRVGLAQQPGHADALVGARRAASGCRSPPRRGARCRPPPAATAGRHTRRRPASRARRRGSARRPRGRSGCHRPRRWRRACATSIPRRKVARSFHPVRAMLRARAVPRIERYSGSLREKGQ